MVPVPRCMQRDIHSQAESDRFVRWGQWLSAANSGDSDRYRELLTELTVYLRGYLAWRFGHSDLLEDYVQEALMAVHDARHTYDARRPFRPWLHAIAKHKTIDCIRRGRRFSDMETYVDQADPAVDPSIALDSSSALGVLAENLRTPLFLTRIVGLTHRECARELGLSEVTVRVCVHRAIQQLRQRLISTVSEMETETEAEMETSVQTKTEERTH